MEVSFLGGGCVRLSGKSLTVLCNPMRNNPSAMKMATKADVVLSSQEWDEQDAAVKLFFDSPGEYEVSGTMIVGIPARLNIDEDGNRCTMYSITMDGINAVITGNMSGKLDATQVDKLGRVDVLVVPVGNHGLTMDAESAAALVGQLDPSYVIPVHYDDGQTEYDVPQDGVDVFLKEMGTNVEPTAKLKVAGRDLPEQPQVVVLNLSA